MNGHRPTRRGCDFHERAGFQADCQHCDLKMKEDEEKLAAWRKGQLEANAEINKENDEECPTWLKIAFGIVAFLAALLGFGSLMF